MAVYVIPRNRYYGGIFGGLGQGAAGIVTNLLGDQISGMMDRARQARDVKLYGKFLGEMDALGDTSGLTKEQMMYATMRNKYYPLMSEDTRNRWQALANERGMNLGLAELSSGMNNLYGKDATNMVTGMMRAGYDPSVQKGLLDIAVPKLETQTHDLGDRVLTYRQNPYRQGIVEGSMMNLGKGVSPDTQLTADVQREGYKNARDIASLESGGRIGAARIAAEAQGRGARATDFGNYVKYAEMLQKEKDGLAFASAEDTAAQDRLKFINNELELVGETLAQYYRPELFAGLPAGGVPQPQTGPPSEEGIAVQMMKNNPELTWGEALRGARELQAQQKK